ncbi:hypothetical protein AOQ84DRAFT_376738 [Glonium stellatum]|uniref:Uncharacterized protein n=1 Tax=Glonium stellatum TaxID=574774 RepID=A0A8E2JT41_9PEZI|nr:hypothetical protein AOQ84DRAFT_376738 [Glonium stellatum]
MRLSAENLVAFVTLSASVHYTVAAPILLNEASSGVHTHPISAYSPNFNPTLETLETLESSSVVTSLFTPTGNLPPIIVTVDVNELLRPDNIKPGGSATEQDLLWDEPRIVEQLLAYQTCQSLPQSTNVTTQPTLRQFYWRPLQ